MKIVMLGIPGSGKGTQSKLLSSKYNIPAISTGDLLRKSNDNSIKQIIDKGCLIDDDTMFKLVKKYVETDSFILDGFPRTLKQAKMIDVDIVFLIDISEQEAVKRLLNRSDNRADDLEHVIRDRFDVYCKETKPLVDYYEKKNILKVINGDTTKENIFNEIDTVLSQRIK